MTRIHKPYVIELSDWDNAFRKFKEGTADCMTGVIFSNTRANNILFSNTHSYISYQLICRKEDTSRYSTLDDLKDKQIIAPKGEIIEETLTAAGYDDHIIYVPNMEVGIKMLSAGRGDVAITADDVARLIIHNNHLKNLDIVDIGIPPMEYCIVLNRDQSLLLQINRALLAMKKDGTFDAIYGKWFPQERIVHQRIMVYSILGILLFLFIVFFSFHFYLRRKIRIITKQKQFENNRYKILFENTIVGLEYYDKDGVLVEMNDADCAIFGVQDKKGLIETGVSLYNNPIFTPYLNRNDIQPVVKVLQYDLRKGVRKNYFDVSSRDEIIYVDTRIFPIKDKDGKIEAIICTTVDVTDRYVTEQKLVESKQQLQLLLEAENLITWAYDVQSHLVTLQDMDNIPANLLHVEVYQKLLHPEDIEKVNNIVTALLNNTIQQSACVARYLMSDGNYHYHNLVMTVFKQDGCIKKMLGSAKDIHEEYLHKIEINKLSVSLDLALEAGDVTVWNYDVDKELFGTVRGKVINTQTITKEQYFDFLHPDDVESQKAIFTSLLDGTIERTSSVFRYLRFDGIYRYYKNYYITQKEEGNVISIIGTRGDITDEIMRSQDLKESLDKLKFAIKGVNAVFFEIDMRTQLFKSYNEPLNDYDENKLLTANDYMTITHPDDCEKTEKSMLSLLEGVDENILLTVRQKNRDDKEWRQVQINIIPFVKDNSGKVIKYVGIRHDITELSNVANKLEQSNHEKDTILRNLPTVIALYDANGKQEFLNEEGFSLFGVTDRQTYVSKCISIYDDPILTNEIKETIKQGKDLNKIIEYDLNLVNTHKYFETEKKSKIYLDAKVRYIKDKDNRVVKNILIINDITRRVEYQQELFRLKEAAIASNQILNQILDNMPCIMYIKNATDNFRYVMANKYFCEYVGHSIDEVIGKVDSEIYAVSNSDKNNYYDKLVVETGEMVTYDDLLNMGGISTYWHIIKSAMTMPNGDIYTVGIATDISQLKKINAELIDAKAKAEEADKLKSTFLANMSHEIRTPLNAIVGFSELLLTTEDEQEKKEYINIINQNNDLLLRLISDILDLSKIESGVVKLKPEQFDLSQIFEEMYATYWQRNSNSQVEFRKYSPYESCIIELDKDRFLQVGTNFITNAIKYTPNGYILIGYEYVDNGIKIFVEDTGIGMSKEKQHLVFQRFEKLDNFAQGTGLGLSICKAIVEAHKGKIGFESSEGKGSYFWAWFPCAAQIEYKTSTTTQPTEDIAREEKLFSKKENTDNLRILVAEDNDSNYLLLRAILKKCTLTRAYNGAEAIDLALNNKYDAILMDMRMPVMGGLEATRKIRESDADIFIVALTANAFDSDKLDAKKAGCNAFIAKPLKKDEIEKVLYHSK